MNVTNFSKITKILSAVVSEILLRNFECYFRMKETFNFHVILLFILNMNMTTGTSYHHVNCSYLNNISVNIFSDRTIQIKMPYYGNSVYCIFFFFKEKEKK